MRNLLARVIADTFIKECGKFQVPLLNKGPEVPKAFKMAFALPTNEGEEGYRNLEVVLFAPQNYVQVWVRETWDVIPTEDLETDDEGDTFVKKGKDYQKGAAPWKQVANHDSCWRDGVEGILKEYDRRLLTFTGPGWFQLVPAKDLECLASSL